jgi:hypothetical protein
MSLLPTAEFVAGNPTGWIYIESLAEALAPRFARLAVTALKEVAIKTSALGSDKLSCVNDGPRAWVGSTQSAPSNFREHRNNIHLGCAVRSACLKSSTRSFSLEG